MIKRVLLSLLLLHGVTYAMEQSHAQAIWQRSKNLEAEQYLADLSPVEKEENDQEVVYKRWFPWDMCAQDIVVVCKNGSSYESNLSEKEPCCFHHRMCINFKYGQVDSERDAALFKKLATDYERQQKENKAKQQEKERQEEGMEQVEAMKRVKWKMARAMGGRYWYTRYNK